jgi:hypothetical protein
MRVLITGGTGEEREPPRNSKDWVYSRDIAAPLADMLTAEKLD